MIKKAMPVTIFFAIIFVVGIVSKSIYFYSLPLAVTTDILYDSPIQYEYTVTGTAQETILHKENIIMPFTGKIIHIYVTEGQEVKTGDLLFSVEVSNLTDEISQINNLIADKKQQIALTSNPEQISELNAQIALLEKQLDEKTDCLTHNVVFSPVDGVVGKVNRKNGDHTSTAYSVIEIVVENTSFKTSLSFSNNYRPFDVGDTIILKNSMNQDCTGIIRNISFGNGQRNIEIELEPSGLYKGEQLYFSDSFSTESKAHIIRNNAIRKDNDSYYVLQLVKEMTSFGEKLYAKRADVYIGITVGEYTEITSGIIYIYPVIMNPEVKDGMEIRVY